jgi:hypothetical protein
VDEVASIFHQKVADLAINVQFLFENFETEESFQISADKKRLQ